MAATRVGIIGGGIVGPVVAIFLKLRGYDPVIYERRPAVLERGIGIGSVNSNHILILSDTEWSSLGLCIMA